MLNGPVRKTARESAYSKLLFPAWINDTLTKACANPEGDCLVVPAQPRRDHKRQGNLRAMGAFIQRENTS